MRYRAGIGAKLQNIECIYMYISWSPIEYMAYY